MTEYNENVTVRLPKVRMGYTLEHRREFLRTNRRVLWTLRVIQAMEVVIGAFLAQVPGVVVAVAVATLTDRFLPPAVMRVVEIHHERRD